MQQQEFDRGWARSNVRYLGLLPLAQTCTNQMAEIRSVASVTLEHNGVKVLLIKIPGFDNTTRSDTDNLMMITSYFTARYSVNIKMDGIIYISPITNPRVSSADVKHLILLFKLIGDEASSNLVLAARGWNMKTSRWDLLSELNDAIAAREAKKSNKFKSNIARIETQRSQQGRENALRSNVRAARFHQARVNFRVVDEERRKFRAEIYQNSLLYFEQATDSKKASNSILQRGSTDVREVDALCKQYRFSIGDQQKLQDLLSHTLTAMAKDTLTFGAWLFYQSYLLRNAILTVYHNCRRLQSAELAGAWFSMLVLEPSSNGRTRVVNLSRVKIDDVREVVERLSSFVTVLQDLISEHTVPHSVSTLTRLSEEVHLLYRKVFERLGLENFLSHHRHWYHLFIELESILSSRSSGGSAYFVDIFAQWWCATRALDVGVVAYESSHVSNSGQTFSIDLGSKLPQIGASKLQDTPQEPGYSRSLQYVSRGLNCLAGFFQKHPVWILAMGEASNDLYLAADIETFADAWGPIWKVAVQSRPDLIAKYNVNRGSIVPWPSNPVIHPKLRWNERLCHWKSNDEYIHHWGEGSANVGMSSILASCQKMQIIQADMHSDSSPSSSELDEIKGYSIQAATFSGNEILVIGADQDARLQWYDCHCSPNAIREDLENAGRLERIVVSRSDRYIDRQQKILWGASHGFHPGVNLKEALLDRWEDEPDLRNPREFENMWGIAASLCTMNAKRVRLVELFVEESVMLLLRHFQWSDLSADGSRSYQRDSFRKAVRSDNPFALGDLWEERPNWRRSLGNAILICLRVLFKTGYNDVWDEFHMLWLPPDCRNPRCVTLKPSEQAWTRLLKDTTYSLTVAVVREGRLGTGPCSGHRTSWFRYPSILETAICVNTNISPARKLIRSRDTDDEYSHMPREDGGRWRRIWKVSDIKPGEKFWMRSQHRLRTICRLNSRHLLLQMDTVKRQKLRALIGMKPMKRREFHREYTDVELDGDGDRPIPVHITS